MRRILVVEDEEQLCVAITAYLKSQGGDSVATATARGAVDILDSSSVDLVVLDLDLSDGQGLALLRHIRESAILADLPVIGMLAWGVEPVSYDYLEPGDYLTKPFDMRRLDWMIRRLLGLAQDQDLGAYKMALPKAVPTNSG